MTGSHVTSTNGLFLGWAVPKNIYNVKSKLSHLLKYFQHHAFIPLFELYPKLVPYVKEIFLFFMRGRGTMVKYCPGGDKSAK